MPNRTRSHTRSLPGTTWDKGGVLRVQGGGNTRRAPVEWQDVLVESASSLVSRSQRSSKFALSDSAPCEEVHTKGHGVAARSISQPSAQQARTHTRYTHKCRRTGGTYIGVCGVGVGGGRAGGRRGGLQALHKSPTISLLRSSVTCFVSVSTCVCTCKECSTTGNGAPWSCRCHETGARVRTPCVSCACGLFPRMQSYACICETRDTQAHVTMHSPPPRTSPVFASCRAKFSVRIAFADFSTASSRSAS